MLLPKQDISSGFTYERKGRAPEAPEVVKAPKKNCSGISLKINEKCSKLALSNQNYG